MRFNGSIKWVLVLSILSLVLITSRCEPNDSASENIEESLSYLNHNDTVKYVGIETCKQCHYSIYKTFVETGMGSSFGIADTTKSIAEISQSSILYDAFSNLSYHPFWRRDSLYIHEFRRKGSDTSHSKEVKIDYVVGSGQHTNSHIYNNHDYLFQAPFTWYAQKAKLDLPPGFENGTNTRFDRKIGLECTSCHNAMPTGFIKGSINKYSKVPSAIDCERCHGPGELHVKRVSNGQLVDTANDIDYSIVNIKKLPIELQFEACQRCHLQGNSVLAEGQNYFDFKPGMKLNEVMDVYLPRYSNAEDEFIMASHVDRFKQSKCYIHNKESFNCVSCHNPHVSVKATNIQNFNNTCDGCHQAAKESICTEEQAKLNAAEYNCVGCHMPTSSSTDIPHVTVHDHKIKVPKLRTDTTALKRFLGLVAINNSQPNDRSKALAYLQQFERFDAKGYMLDSANFFLKRLPKDKVGNGLWVHYFFLRRDYPSLVAFIEGLGRARVLGSLTQTDYENRDAWTAYRIGEAYNNQGGSLALDFYKKATELAPFIPDFRNKYASELLASGNINIGISLLEKLLEEQPNHKEALNNLGFTYLQQGKTQLASLYLNRAIKEDPDYEKGWLNIASLYIVQQNNTEALNAIDEVLRINPRNPKAKAARDFLLEQM